MWLTILSDQLPVVALVGLYPTNKLIGRETLPARHKHKCLRLPSPKDAFQRPSPVLQGLSANYPESRDRFLTCYSPVRRSVVGRILPVARLACLIHAASVRPEPGSNSP
jgi:hypothetical protein